MAPTQTMTDMYQDANGLWIKTAEYRHAPTPVDGDDMTWDEDTLSKDTAIASESALSQIWDDDDELEDDGYLALFIEVKAQRQMIHRLQNEMAGLAAQVVELRERMDRNEADS